jgi:elongation factor G
MAFQEGCRRAKPVILEPIMKLEVIAPEKFMGDITGSIASKRGLIEGTSMRGQAQVISAKVPLSEMFGYTTQLRSMTSGQGSAMMEFDHYEVVPPNVEKEIVAARK